MSETMKKFQEHIRKELGGIQNEILKPSKIKVNCDMLKPYKPLIEENNKISSIPSLSTERDCVIFLI